MSALTTMLGKVTGIFAGQSIRYVYLAVILGVVAYVGSLKYTISSLNDDIDKLNLLVKTLQVETQHGKNNLTECQLKITESNGYIARLNEDSKNRDVIVGMLKENIALVRKVTAKDIGNIQNAVVPQTCTDAMNFLREGVGK
jgi:hypothetical protein